MHIKSRVGFRLSLLVALLATVATGQAQNPQARAKVKRGTIRHVIIISVDGLMPEAYLQAEKHGLKIPTLREIVSKGAVSDGAQSVFPTLTYPAHTSIATGTNPGTHGIAGNELFDPENTNQRGWLWYAEDIRAPTLWDAARERGLRTALVAWPVTVGARATSLLPEYWRAGNAEDVKLLRALATPGLIDTVARRFPTFLDGLTPPSLKDSALTDVAVHAIETLRPHLLMLHIFEVDHFQHAQGPFSNEAKAAIENADAQITRVIAAAKKAGIWQHTALVVASDHGFARFEQRFRPGVYFAQQGLVTLDERSRVVAWKAALLTAHGIAYVYLKDPNDERTRQQVLDLLEPMRGKAGSGINHIYSADEIRAFGGDPQAALAFSAEPGYDMVGGYSGDVFFPPGSVAGHGYDPRDAAMRASLLLYGPAIAPGKLEGARLIDIAPTAAHWLGLKLEKAEGHSLTMKKD